MKLPLLIYQLISFSKFIQQQQKMHYGINLYVQHNILSRLSLSLNCGAIMAAMAAADGGGAVVADVSFSEKLPISSILIIVAMQEEALPLVHKFQLKQDHHVSSLFPAGVPWVRYNGSYKELYINIIWLGNDRVFGVNSVGTVSASLATYASIQAFRPNLIINAGTAGGFKAKGAYIGDIYLASDVSFHDRRIPIPVFNLYGVGLVQAFSTPNMLNTLNLKVGKLSTGNSLDISPEDEASIILNNATVKDMEGAAVAYVANLMKVPVIFAKGVTDIVDGDKPTAQEFRQNLASVTVALDRALAQIVDFINGKAPHEL